MHYNFKYEDRKVEKEFNVEKWQDRRTNIFYVLDVLYHKESLISYCRTFNWKYVDAIDFSTVGFEIIADRVS